MTIWSWLDDIDKSFFTFINVKAAVPALDGFMELMRLAGTWVPLYAFILYWIIRYARKSVLQFVALSIITFALTDFISASILKPLFARPRPCYNPELQSVIRVLVDCAGKFSLPSSHASNHFGLAAFWFQSIYFLKNKRWYWLWLWAFIICYAQVYVGKHYPFDILAGAVFGILTGSITALIFRKWVSASNKKLNNRTNLTS